MLVGIEAFVRLFTLALRKPSQTASQQTQADHGTATSLLDLLYAASQSVFNRLASPARTRPERRQCRPLSP